MNWKKKEHAVIPGRAGGRQSRRFIVRGIPLIRALLWFASLGCMASCGASQDPPPDEVLRRAIGDYYKTHYVRPLAHLNNPEMFAGAMQKVLRYEVTNTYPRRIEGEQVQFYDIAVETQSGAGIVVELLPFRFVKRGKDWYSAIDAERSIQTLPKHSFSKDVVTLQSNGQAGPRPSGTQPPVKDFSDRRGFNRAGGLDPGLDNKVQSQTREAETRKASPSPTPPLEEEFLKPPVDFDVPTWQESVSPVVRLGIRDKYATLRNYEVVFVVIDPNGRRFSTNKIPVEADMSAYVLFPSDFTPYPSNLVSGKYRWSARVSDREVSASDFDW